jgi:hypothetical protein
MSLEKLLKLVALPRDPDDAATRAQQSSLLDLLDEERKGDWLMLYGSSFDKGGSVMLHSVLVPADDLSDIDGEELTHWSGNPYDSWGCGLVWGGGEPPRVEFTEPPSRLGSQNLLRAQQLVFGRSFNGRGEDKRYFEISHFLTHAHGLHWTPERRAWCRFDDNGDIEDVIVWAEEEGRGGYGTAVCIAIKREVLEMQMSATRTVLVQMFDSTAIPSGFSGWGSGAEQSLEDAERGLYYRYRIEVPNSYFRGVQIIKAKRTAQEYGAYLEALEKRPKQYESFITHDWKNERIATVSCAPDALSSYFEKDSPLPFQTSPVFFNAAVLDKYKADPEKYTLEHRSITCRNSWHLETYDANDAGQVHTYICYLGNLPYSEQVYWKSFNELPKSGISKRALTTDFEGNFDTEPDSLRDIQALVSELHVAKSAWYTLREEELIKQLHYPLTSSAKAWGEALGTLAKIVVEGLERRFFEATVARLGGQGDSKWGSILWAREALKVSGVDETAIPEVIQPFLDLQSLRTKLGAHSGGEEAKKLRASLLRDHKSPRGHFDHLCERLVHSLRILKETFK